MKNGKLSIRFIQSVLLISAAATSISAIFAGWDAAVDIAGEIPGTVFVITSEIIIYMAWLYIANSKSDSDTADGNSDSVTLSKIVAGVLAISFAGVSIFAIHQSSNVKADKSTSAQVIVENDISAKERLARADALHVALKKLNELDPKKSPVQYKHTSDLVNSLSAQKPEEIKTSNSAGDDNNKDSTKTKFSWLVAVIFQIFTPSLLLLAGFFGRNISQQETIEKVLSPGKMFSAVIEYTNYDNCDNRLISPECVELSAIITYDNYDHHDIETIILPEGVELAAIIYLPIMNDIAACNLETSKPIDLVANFTFSGVSMGQCVMHTDKVLHHDMDDSTRSKRVFADTATVKQAFIDKTVIIDENGLTKKDIVNIHDVKPADVSNLINELIKLKALKYAKVSNNTVLVYY